MKHLKQAIINTSKRVLLASVGVSIAILLLKLMGVSL